LSIKESGLFLRGIHLLQALRRGYMVRKRMRIFKQVTKAAAKIQSAYRRYRVLKWINNDQDGDDADNDDDDDNAEIIDVSPLKKMDQLCGFYSSPLRADDSPSDREKDAYSANVIRAMQLEIKRLQRLVSRQEKPLIPIDSPVLC